MVPYYYRKLLASISTFFVLTSVMSLTWLAFAGREPLSHLLPDSKICPMDEVLKPSSLIMSFLSCVGFVKSCIFKSVWLFALSTSKGCFVFVNFSLQHQHGVIHCIFFLFLFTGDSLCACSLSTRT